jgi:hypothetical protein
MPALVCGTEKLSPDGGVLACLDRYGVLHFFDVVSGRAIFEKKRFAAPFEIFGHLTPIDSESASMEFSPGGEFIIVRSEDPEGSLLVWNVHGKN